MKNIITALVTLVALSTTAYADIARVEAGFGAWMQSPTTSMKYERKAGLSGNDVSKDGQEETQGYVWLLVKHPLPIIPNIRLEYTNISSEGIGSGEFDFFPSPISGDTKSELEMTQVDIIPYYNILDNTAWITLDIGLDFKIVDTTYTIDSYEEKTSSSFPLLYLRGRFEIPATNVGVESDLKYIKYGDTEVVDFRAKLDYTFEFVPVVQPAVEIGYRMEKLYEVSDEKLKSDFEFSGVYVGAMVRF